MLNGGKTMTFTNAEYGINAVVTKIETGYSVAIQDVDSGDYLDSVIICKTEEAAIAKAKEVTR
jgi:hypothetical protein